MFGLLNFEEGDTLLRSLSNCRLTLLLQQEGGVAGNECR